MCFIVGNGALLGFTVGRSIVLALHISPYLDIETTIEVGRGELGNSSGLKIF